VDPRLVESLHLPTVRVDDRVVVLANGSKQDGSQVVPVLKYRLGQTG